MIIKTEFGINNIVAHKFMRFNDNFTVLEVMQIHSETCYAGTQVFYLCRPIVVSKKYKNLYDKEGDFKWVVDHALSRHQMGIEWQKYREDELIAPSQEVIDIILNKE